MYLHAIQEHMTLDEKVKHLYDEFGQRKSIGVSELDTKKPHYFLLRTFMHQNDLLIIFNTKRCRYQCYFCQLPAKSSKVWISEEEILTQFEYVLDEIKHSLSIIDRLTLSNEGSVLDTKTLSTNTLLVIAKCVHELHRVRTLVLETRLEFIDPYVIEQIKASAPRIKINILTGFETKDPQIRDQILFKRETLDAFLQGLDRVAQVGAELTCYVLYKPDPGMSDNEAFVEAGETIDYLAEHCGSRNISLTIRLNPMYLAKGSRWAKEAYAVNYKPPRLTDVMKVAEEKALRGIRIYIGLSAEGLDEPGGNYMYREDYSSRLIKPIKLFNDGKISHFDWTEL